MNFHTIQFNVFSIGAVVFAGPGATTGIRSPFGEGGGELFLEELRCDGNESTLFQCLQRSRCERGEDAAVMCQSNGETSIPIAMIFE